MATPNLLNHGRFQRAHHWPVLGAHSQVKVRSYSARQAHGSGGAETSSIILGLLAWLMIPFALLSLGAGEDAPRRGGHVTHKMTIRVRQCRACARNEIVPIEANHESGTMRLLVDKRFGECFREENRG